jgi:hypothetical protein
MHPLTPKCSLKKSRFASDPSARTRQTGGVKSHRRLFIWLGSFVLLAVIAVAGWSLWTRHQVNAAKARIRAAGLPTTIAEIRPPAIPDGDNAFPLIEKIGTLVKASPSADSSDGREKLAEFRKAAKPSPEEIDAIARLLDTPPLREELALVREAAAKPGYDAHIPFEQGPALLIPAVGWIRNSLVTLAASARLASLRGDRERAFADLSAMLVVAEFMRDEPILISQLTRVAAMGITLDALERIVAEQGLSGGSCEKLAAKLGAIDLRTGMVRAIDGERVGFGGYYFELFAGKSTDRELAGALGIEPNKGLTLAFEFYRLSHLSRLDYTGYLDRMREMRLEYANPSHSPARQTEEMRKISSDIPRFHVFTRIVMPTLATVCQKSTFGQQKMAVAALGLALERYRQAHGDYPADLAGLTPDFIPVVPRDLFSEKPLRYERSARGAILYSVGVNLRDDGGVQDSDTDKDDIAWRAGDYEPPAL